MNRRPDPLERGRSVAHPAVGWIAVALGAVAIASLSLVTEAAVLLAIGAIGSGELPHLLAAVPVVLALSVIFPGVTFLPVATLVSALGIVIARSAHGERVPRRTARGIAALGGAIYAVASMGGLPRTVGAREVTLVIVTSAVGSAAGLASYAVGRHLAAADRGGSNGETARGPRPD